MARPGIVLFLLSTGLLAAQTPPSHPMFDRDAVHTIQLRFAQPDWWEQLEANYTNNADNVPYIEASFAWGDVRFEAVGVRFKGNSSYDGARTKKKPFRIKLTSTSTAVLPTIAGCGFPGIPASPLVPSA
jgi:hypothetical protein